MAGFVLTRVDGENARLLREMDDAAMDKHPEDARSDCDDGQDHGKDAEPAQAVGAFCGLAVALNGFRELAPVVIARLRGEAAAVQRDLEVSDSFFGIHAAAGGVRTDDASIKDATGQVCEAFLLKGCEMAQGDSRGDGYVVQRDAVLLTLLPELLSEGHAFRT